MTLPSSLKRKRSQPFDFSDTSTVVIEIGPNATPFTIHKEVLCLHSEYFRAAFKGGFREADEGKIPLADTTPEAFKMVLMWLYTKELEAAPTLPLEEHKDNVDTQGSHNNHPKDEVRDEDKFDDEEVDYGAVREDMDAIDIWMHATLDAYIFADKYQIPGLRFYIIKAWQNVALEMVEEGMIMSTSLIHKSYAKLPAQDPLCRYITTFCAYETDWSEDRDMLSKLPHEFVVEVVMISKARLSYRLPTESTVPFEVWCDFHEHANATEREECEDQLRKEHIVENALRMEDEVTSWRKRRKVTAT